MKKNSPDFRPEIIIDTNTFFSALYNPDGNEALLLEMADRGKCSIQIIDYVLDELRMVFEREEIDFKLVTDLLDTYENIYICELEELEYEEIDIAKKNVKDASDRPIFIFAYRRIKQNDNVFFVSGDKGFFNDKILELLDNRVYKTKE
ncbi:MAG: hypothetical protein R6U61_03660, partial [Thermoplasmata archaeon]